MSYDETLKSVSLDADSSLAGYTGISGQPGAADPNYGKALFRFVKLTAAHTVGRAAANTDVVIGVCQNKPQVVGQAATVAIFGITNVIAGAAVPAMSKVTADSQGRGIVDPATGGSKTYGIAIEAAAGAGHLFPVLLRLN